MLDTCKSLGHWFWNTSGTAALQVLRLDAIVEMPATGTSSNIVLAGATLPSPQDVKRQASRIYDALDARGYGIIKRQTVAEALPDNRVSMKLNVIVYKKHRLITSGCAVPSSGG